MTQYSWHTPKLLNRFNCESKSENNGRKKGVRVRSLAHSTLGVEGHVRIMR